MTIWPLKILIAIVVSITLSITACATDIKVFGKPQYWLSSVYSTLMPPPFNEVTVTFKGDATGQVTSIRIKTDLGEKVLDKSFTAQLQRIAEPSLTFLPEKNDPNRALSLSVYFEFGEYVFVEKYQDSLKSIAGFSVDQNMLVYDVEVTPFSAK